MENLKEKAKKIIYELPEDKLAEAIDFMEYLKTKHKINSDTEFEEDKDWLDFNLEELPEYDWGPSGPPTGKPVKYIPGVGLIVERRQK